MTYSSSSPLCPPCDLSCECWVYKEENTYWKVSRNPSFQLQSISKLVQELQTCLIDWILMSELEYFSKTYNMQVAMSGKGYDVKVQTR